MIEWNDDQERQKEHSHHNSAKAERGMTTGNESGAEWEQDTFDIHILIILLVTLLHSDE